MTQLDVLERVHKIALLAECDYEAAHSEEDKLHSDVLAFIASPECTDINKAKTLCANALNTKGIDFERYTA